MHMSEVYRYPHYYALGYRWNTEEECDVLEACLARWHPGAARRVLDLGCGAGRHALELAARGYDVTGIDPSPAMVAYAREQAMYRGLDVTVHEGSLQQFEVTGPFDLAICLMDTFRFLLTDDEIIAHVQRVAAQVSPDGLYITDFWVPRDSTQPPAEHYEWEQRSETTQVRVEYAQYPDSFDPAARLFEDELTFHVIDDGVSQMIPGGRTRTRLLLAEEFAALVERARCFAVRGHYDGFDLARPRLQQPLSWRMVTILQRLAQR